MEHSDFDLSMYSADEIKEAMRAAMDADNDHAHSAGHGHVKTELENLSFHYRCPREYEQIERMLEELKKAEGKNLEGFISKVRELLEGNGIKARIELCYRMPYSIWRKMHSKGCDFHHVDGKHYDEMLVTLKTLHISLASFRFAAYLKNFLLIE